MNDVAAAKHAIYIAVGDVCSTSCEIHLIQDIACMQVNLEWN